MFPISDAKMKIVLCKVISKLSFTQCGRPINKTGKKKDFYDQIGSNSYYFILILANDTT